MNVLLFLAVISCSGLVGPHPHELGLSSALRAGLAPLAQAAAVFSGSLHLASDAVVLDNDYVRVVRGSAPCAAAGAGCAERVIVALGPVAMGGRTMSRGDIAAFEAGKAYTPPSSGDYVEVAFQSNRPPTESPEELIAPDKNSMLYDGDRLFVFEEKLEPGDTRPRHSHSQRVVIVINETRLQQWPDGSEEIFKDQVPDTIKFNEPVIHVVKNVGKAPLRNIVLELKPED